MSGKHIFDESKAETNIQANERNTKIKLVWIKRFSDYFLFSRKNIFELCSNKYRKKQFYFYMIFYDIHWKWRVKLSTGLFFVLAKLLQPLQVKPRNCVYIIAQHRKLWTKTACVYRRCCKRSFWKALEYKRRGELSKRISELCKIFRRKCNTLILLSIFNIFNF